MSLSKDCVNYKASRLVVWGGFSVNNATLNRFFSLHFVLPFVLSALALVHMMTLHTNGSSNPLGLSSNCDKLPMAPYFLFKDLVTMWVFLAAITGIVCYAPNLLGHSDNYIPANPMSTPASIVPEWLSGASYKLVYTGTFLSKIPVASRFILIAQRL